MRFHLPSFAFIALSLPLAGMATISACGGDSTTGDAGPDGTTADVTPDVAKDVAPDVVTDAGCANDVDLTQYLPSADASIDVDAGGLNISVCTDCLKTNCGTEINACNQDCACRQDIVDTVTCVAQGGSFQTCALSVISEPNVGNLFGCAVGHCQSACLGGGGDGGKVDSGVTDSGGGG